MNLNSRQILSLICLTFSQAFSSSALASPSKIQQGDTLIQDGLQRLDRNQPDVALQQFEEAYSIYKESNHLSGLNRASINKSVALNQMGQYYRACTTLTTVLSLNHKICQSQSEEKLPSDQLDTRLGATQEIAALHNLGNNLQILGKLESSERALKQALSIDPRNRPNIQLSLANTYQSQYKAAINRLSVSVDPVSEADAANVAQAHAQAAINLYEGIASNETHNIHAQLNGLQLILHLGESDHPKFNQSYQQSRYLIEPFIKDLTSIDFSQFPDSEAINLQLKLSGLLKELDKPTDAFHHARAALVKADALQNFRWKSLAYGTLGKIYLKSGQHDDATQVFQKALKLAQAINEDSLAYQWSWQMAQIHRQQGHQTPAIAAYETSIKHLDQVRTTLISANSDLQFSYEESVEPVYAEYLQLLLSSKSPDLELVLSTHQELQVAELENFLKCSKLETAKIDRLQQSDRTTRIHIFKLGDKVEVIAQSAEGLFRHQPDSVAVGKDLNNLLRLVDDEQFYQTPETKIQQYSQALYKNLLGPIQSHLPKSGSLIFHLDKNFQNLPMALLHDGQNYLIKKYSLQTALNTNLRQIQPNKTDRKNVLFAGLSTPAPSFNRPDVPSNLNPLPEVEDELDGVKKFASLQSSLLNDKFTSNRLEATLGQNTGIIHIASHGQFSSDPQQTFLLAYDEPINARKFHDLINQKSEIGQSSIDLLILSACETAKGDRRSALGIAGMAIQAGSRNTLATLWLAESSSTSELITLFYQGLKNNRAKADALQQAQIQLMGSKKYSHPYFWGNFVLVGS